MIRQLALSAVLVCAVTPVAAQNFVTMDIGSARQLATQSLLVGNASGALRLAEQLRDAAPDDREALLIITAAAGRVGDFDKAREAGLAALAMSEDDQQRYEAARLLARAAADAERFGTSSYWLRRSLVFAPDVAAQQASLRDARAVAVRNPLRMGASFSIAPSQNVNGGATNSISSAPGNPTGRLSDDALALAGWRAVSNLSIDMRLWQSDDARLQFGFDTSTARVRITDATDIPDAAFATDWTEVGLDYRWVGQGNSVSAGLTRGRLRYGDYDNVTGTISDQHYDTRGLSFGYRQALGAQTVASVTYDRVRLDYLNPRIHPVTRDEIGLGLRHQSPNGDVISSNWSRKSSESDSVNYRKSEQSFQLGYNRRAPIGPVSLSGSLSWSWAEYPDYVLLFPVTGGRQDHTVAGSVTLGLSEMSFAGFTPQITFSTSRTDSNVSRFVQESRGVGLSFQSQF